MHDVNIIFVLNHKGLFVWYELFTESDSELWKLGYGIENRFSVRSLNSL